MDLLMGGFCDAQIGELTEIEVDEFEQLIDLQDHDLYQWIVGQAPLPTEVDTPFFRKLRDFHTHMSPRFS